MEDFIIILILALVIGLSIRAVIKAKKKGGACAGCPHSGSCSGNCGKENR